RVRRRILRLESLHRLKVGRVGHDFRKPLQLLQLIYFCSSLLFLNDSSAHDNSSPFAKLRKVRPKQKIDKCKSCRRCTGGISIIHREPAWSCFSLGFIVPQKWSQVDRGTALDVGGPLLKRSEFK